MSDSLSFKYTLTEDDFAITKRISARSFPMYWFQWVMIFFVTVSAGFLLFWIASGIGQTHWSFKLLPGLAIVGWLAHWWDYYAMPKRMARKIPGFLIEQDVTFSAEGLSRRNALASGDVNWKAFTKARETDAYFLLYSSKYFFFPFPKRFLADPQDVNRFRDLIRAHVPNAKLLDRPEK